MDALAATAMDERAQTHEEARQLVNRAEETARAVARDQDLLSRGGYQLHASAWKTCSSCCAT